MSGTGTLAAAVKHRVGPTGSVNGIDASREMIARARAKALRSGVKIQFDNAVAHRARRLIAAASDDRGTRRQARQSGDSRSHSAAHGDRLVALRQNGAIKR